MRRPRLLAAALLALPALATAQGPVSTGASVVGGLDQNYQVSYTFGGTSTAFTNANVLPLAFGGTFGPGAVGIAASPTGSLPGGNPDSFLTRFRYTFRTTFIGGSATGFTYRCAVDDTFISVVLNGSVVAGAGCDQYALNTTFTVTGLVSGTNVLEFNATGNGTTDSFALRVASVTMSAVPEPGTWALLGTGLLAVGGVARRRRTSVV
jgi:hypothetical protein